MIPNKRESLQTKSLTGIFVDKIYRYKQQPDSHTSLHDWKWIRTVLLSHCSTEIKEFVQTQKGDYDEATKEMAGVEPGFAANHNLDSISSSGTGPTAILWKRHMGTLMDAKAMAFMRCRGQIKH